MSTERPSLHERQIDDVLKQVNRYWRGGGVPRPDRRDRLEELRDHLQQATVAGRRVEDVVGSDVYAFAADWMEAERPRPWLDIALRAVATLALTAGGIALLGLIAPGQDPSALTGLPLVVVAVAVLATVGADITRRYRGQLSTRGVALLYIVGVAAAGLIGGSAAPLLDGRIVVELPWPLAIVFIATGAACAEISRRMRRTRRTTAA